MTQTRVINISKAPRGWETNPDYVYIGRRGRGQSGYFGNPFRLGEHGSRAEVLDLYKTWFLDRLDTDPDFREAIEALQGKILVCFCKPQTCHGDVIAEYLNEEHP